MEVSIPYDEAIKRYPEQVKEIVSSINKGKSKIAGTDPATWQWKISYYLTGKLMSIQEVDKQIAANIAKTPEQREQEWQALMNRTAKERVDDKLSRTGGSLVGGYSRVFRGAKINMPPVPKEVVKIVTEDAEKAYEHDQQELKKSPEQRKRELQENLKALQGMGGFTTLKFSPKK